MVVRAQPDGWRHAASGVRTATADRGSTAQSVEQFGLRHSSTFAAACDHYHSNRRADDSDDGVGRITNTTACNCRRGSGCSIANCGAEECFAGCVQLDNIYVDHDRLLDRRDVGRRFDDPAIN